MNPPVHLRHIDDDRPDLSGVELEEILLGARVVTDHPVVAREADAHHRPVHFLRTEVII